MGSVRYYEAIGATKQKLAAMMKQREDGFKVLKAWARSHGGKLATADNWSLTVAFIRVTPVACRVRRGDVPAPEASKSCSEPCAGIPPARARTLPGVDSMRRWRFTSPASSCCITCESIGFEWLLQKPLP